MSDMAPQEARDYLATYSTGDSADMWKINAARTVAAQSKQIERLQAAVNYTVIYSLQDAFDLVVDGVLYPEDIEDPK